MKVSEHRQMLSGSQLAEWVLLPLATLLFTTLMSGIEQAFVRPQRMGSTGDR